MTISTVDREPRSKVARGLFDLNSAAARLPALTIPERERMRRRLLGRLREEVQPVTGFDEGLLFPAVATRLDEPLVTVSMNYDRLAIEHWISALASADVHDTSGLQELLWGLEYSLPV